MIVASHLTKKFGSFTAIDDVSFEVARGEIVGFLGPNGAGKSTTMRILSGVFPPTGGSAVVAGHDVVDEPLEARRKVGYFPERVALYLDMRVDEYFDYVARMKRIPRATRREEIERALQSCDLTDVSHRMIGMLSKGYRQRVGIAQALLGRPEVLILDEPTAGLDPEQVAGVRDLIRGLRGQSTVILSTHILSEVEATCDRVIIIYAGKILAVDTPQNLNRRLRPTTHIHVELRASVDEAVRAIRPLPGVEDVTPGPARDGTTSLTVAAAADTDIRSALAETITGRHWDLLELRPVHLSLEDIFLDLIAERENREEGTAPDA